MESFSDIAKREFNFLKNDFGYEILDAGNEHSKNSVKFINREVGVGVEVLYDYSCAIVIVFIYRLVDGELRRNPSRICKDTEINCFDFSDCLSDELQIKPTYEYTEDSVYFDEVNGLRNYTKDFAKLLKTYGQDILKGDMSIIPTVSSIIKQRAAQS